MRIISAIRNGMNGHVIMAGFVTEKHTDTVYLQSIYKNKLIKIEIKHL